LNVAVPQSSGSSGVWAVAHTKISGVHYFKNVIFIEG